MDGAGIAGAVDQLGAQGLPLAEPDQRSRQLAVIGQGMNLDGWRRREEIRLGLQSNIDRCLVLRARRKRRQHRGAQQAEAGGTAGFQELPTVHAVAPQATLRARSAAVGSRFSAGMTLSAKSRMFRSASAWGMPA